MTGVQTCALPISLAAANFHIQDISTDESDLEDIFLALTSNDPETEIGRASCRERV